MRTTRLRAAALVGGALVLALAGTQSAHGAESASYRLDKAGVQASATQMQGASHRLLLVGGSGEAMARAEGGSTELASGPLPVLPVRGGPVEPLPDAIFASGFEALPPPG